MTYTATRPTSRDSINPGLCGVLAGSFAANALPHLYFGLAGLNHMTPFGDPSSPMVNIGWGAANVVIAAAAARMGSGRGATAAFPTGVVVGVIGTIFSLVILWA